VIDGKNRKERKRENRIGKRGRGWKVKIRKRKHSKTPIS